MRGMKVYHDTANNLIYAYEADGSQDSYIQPHFERITEEQAEEIIRIKNTPTAEQNSLHAKALLAETDWAENPSVTDQSAPPYLENYQDYVVYRKALRAMMISPQEGYIDFPVKPNAVWNNG